MCSVAAVSYLSASVFCQQNNCRTLLYSLNWNVQSGCAVFSLGIV